MNKEYAVEYLSKDRHLNIDMLESIRRGSAELIEVLPNGVTLYNTACQAVMMSTDNASTASRMLQNINEAPMFVAHQSFCVDEIKQKFAFNQELVCHQAVYLKSSPLPVIESDFDIVPLGEEHCDFVFRHYSHADGDEDYIRDRLRAGVMYGALVKGELAGFIGMHPEGSIGLLEVLPAFQRRGVAMKLESFYVNRLLEQGEVPFAQIETDNVASFELHRRLGFEFSKGRLFWMMDSHLT